MALTIYTWNSLGLQDHGT